MSESELIDLIRQTFNQRFADFENYVKEDLGEIKQRIRELSENMVHRDRFESKMHNVRRLQEMVQAQEKRISRVEAFVKGFTTVLKWGLGICTALIIGVGIAALTGLLKL